MTPAPAMTQDGFHPAFAELAEHMLRERERAWPDMVKAGKLPQGTASHRLFVLRSIAEIWRCAADNLNPKRHFMGVTRAEALEELAVAIDAAETRCRHKPEDAQRQLQRDQLIAMRWWHARYPAGRTSYAMNMLLMVKHEANQLAQAAATPEQRNAA
ncbi:hypothetical protein [Sphingomonas sp. SRS2]|uniref:hypothetical protein n=1 Tax=Sphingomonas sp. SRS2 TaxID=133190 RepID=UPI0006184417|nr:hypothetical protein [Sphingomonas sp. SRS2]KKC24896.1 hypothetical protein WP12_16850 [Sphingomonas sp. SRS2]